MAVGLNEYLNDKFGIEAKDIRSYSPLTLAYIGDAIFDVDRFAFRIADQQ